MKVCTKCESRKPDSEFAAKGARLQPYCKDCNRAYQRDHYQRNKQDYQDKERRNKQARRKQNHTWLFNYLKNHPCEHCGEADPVVLEFDHLDPADKSANIGNMRGSWSLSRLQAEVAKCRVLCANCHKRHTAIQQGWYQ